MKRREHWSQKTLSIDSHSVSGPHPGAIVWSQRLWNYSDLLHGLSCRASQLIFPLSDFLAADVEFPKYLSWLSSFRSLLRLPAGCTLALDSLSWGDPSWAVCSLYGRSQEALYLSFRICSSRVQRFTVFLIFIIYSLTRVSCCDMVVLAITSQAIAPSFWKTQDSSIHPFFEFLWQSRWVFMPLLSAQKDSTSQHCWRGRWNRCWVPLYLWTFLFAPRLR